jgi:hypothetical protein
LSSLKKIDYTLIISLFSISTFPILFFFRAIDDNRLTSWTWVFKDIYAIKIYLILILGTILAYVLSKVNPPSPPFIKGGMGGFLFLFSFLIVIPFWRESEVIIDSSRYFTQAKHLKVYGIGYFIREWGKDLPVWTDLPVIPFFYGLIFKFLGESRSYIQIFTTLLFSMTVVLTYRIGKILWDEDTGFFAGLLILGIPYIFTQVPLMLVDVPTMFFLTLSIFTFVKALNHGGIWLSLSSITIFLTLFSKYSAWLMLSVLVVIFLVYRPQTSDLRPQTHIYRGLTVALISALLIGAVFLYKFDLFAEQLKLLMSYQRPMLKSWGESFISTFFFQIHPFITIAAIYSIYGAFKKKELKYIIISYLVILIILMQIKRIRYTIMVFPMLTLMASYGLQEIKTKEIRRFIVLCIVVSSIIIAIFAYLPFIEKISTVNLKNAGEFLNSLDVENIEAFALPSTDSTVNPAVSVPILDLFTKKKIYYDYSPDFPPVIEEIEKSPLRFTWEYKNPGYYSYKNNKVFKESKAVVVISKDQDETLPPQIEQRIKGYRNSKVFKSHEGVFQYRPIARIFW